MGGGDEMLLKQDFCDFEWMSVDAYDFTARFGESWATNLMKKIRIGSLSRVRVETRVQLQVLALCIHSCKCVEQSKAGLDVDEGREDRSTN